MNAKDWKFKNSKEITLKSGLEVRVRRLSPFALAKIGPIPKLEDIPAERNLEVAEAIIKAGIISPRWGTGEDEISAIDLTLEEVNEITEAIMDITRRPDTLPLESASSEVPVPS